MVPSAERLKLEIYVVVGVMCLVFSCSPPTAAVVLQQQSLDMKRIFGV